MGATARGGGVLLGLGHGKERKIIQEKRKRKKEMNE